MPDITIYKEGKCMTDILKADITDCEMLLIGIGDEWKCNAQTDSEKIIDIYNMLNDYLGKKNYFIVTSCDDGLIYKSNLNKKRITAPFFEQEKGEEQWNFYNRWLQSTLNHRLLLLELGEGFASPNFMRWPFENITFINNKAKLYRVHAKLPNIADNIRDKAVSVKENSVEFLKKMLENAD